MSKYTSGACHACCNTSAESSRSFRNMACDNCRRESQRSGRYYTDDVTKIAYEHHIPCHDVTHGAMTTTNHIIISRDLPMIHDEDVITTNTNKYSSEKSSIAKERTRKSDNGSSATEPHELDINSTCDISRPVSSTDTLCTSRCPCQVVHIHTIEQISSRRCTTQETDLMSGKCFQCLQKDTIATRHDGQKPHIVDHSTTLQTGETSEMAAKNSTSDARERSLLIAKNTISQHNVSQIINKNMSVHHVSFRFSVYIMLLRLLSFVQCHGWTNKHISTAQRHELVNRHMYAMQFRGWVSSLLTIIQCHVGWISKFISPILYVWMDRTERKSKQKICAGRQYTGTHKFLYVPRMSWVSFVLVLMISPCLAESQISKDNISSAMDYSHTINPTRTVDSSTERIVDIASDLNYPTNQARLESSTTAYSAGRHTTELQPSQGTTTATGYSRTYTPYITTGTSTSSHDTPRTDITQPTNHNTARPSSSQLVTSVQRSTSLGSSSDTTTMATNADQSSESDNRLLNQTHATSTSDITDPSKYHTERTVVNLDSSRSKTVVLTGSMEVSNTQSTLTTHGTLLAVTTGDVTWYTNQPASDVESITQLTRLSDASNAVTSGHITWYSTYSATTESHITWYTAAAGTYSNSAITPTNTQPTIYTSTESLVGTDSGSSTLTTQYQTTNQDLSYVPHTGSARGTSYLHATHITDGLTHTIRTDPSPRDTTATHTRITGSTTLTAMHSSQTSMVHPSGSSDSMYSRLGSSDTSDGYVNTWLEDSRSTRTGHPTIGATILHGTVSDSHLNTRAEDSRSTRIQTSHPSMTGTLNDSYINTWVEDSRSTTRPDKPPIHDRHHW